MMRSHLIGFDLDKTLSDEHIYNLIATRYSREISKLEGDIEGLEERRKTWEKVVAQPEKQLKKDIEGKKQVIQHHEEILKKAEAEIKAKEGGASKNMSDTRRLNLSLSGSFSASGDVFLDPEQRLENAKAAIQEVNEEIAAIEKDRPGRIAALKIQAEEKVSSYDVKIAKAKEELGEIKAKQKALVTSEAAQWALVQDKKIGSMCDPKLLQAIVKSLQDDGHVVALVSYNSFENTVKRFLVETVGLDLANIPIECELPSPRAQGVVFKNEHLKRVVERLDDDLKNDLKSNPDRVILIDDDGKNVEAAKKNGHAGSFHFDFNEMKKIDKKNAPNAYLAYLIVKFGYEQKLSEDIARLNLGPMIEHFKKMAVGVGLNKAASTALHRAGALPVIGVRTSKPASPSESLVGSPSEVQTSPTKTNK